jgi:ABC-type multidrug transport system fused ATPase/permease subunit
MKTILKEYWKILSLRKLAFFSLLFLIILNSLFEVIAPLFYKDFANAISGNFSEESYKIAITALFCVAGIYTLEWITWRLFEFTVISVEAKGMRDLAKKAFYILQQQKYEFFQNEFSGSLVKKASRFVNSFEKIVDFIVFQMVGNLFLLLGGIIVFFFQSSFFALYFFIFTITFLGFAIGYSLYQFPFHTAAAEMDSKISGKYADTFSNIFTVKSSGKEKQEQLLISNVSDDWFVAKRKAWIYMFIGFAVQAFLWISFEIFLNYQMIQEWKAGNLSVGDFILFNSIILIVMHKLWEFGHSLRHFFGALSDAQEMAEIIKKNDIENDADTAEDFVIKNGKIEFKNVCFGYTSDLIDEQKKPINTVETNYNSSLQKINPEKNLFTNFNLKINAGEKIALVGASGSGKTTITKLLFRFYTIFSGKIVFDDKNAQEISLHSLRSQISLVPQRPELFHRTIKENLLFAKPNASDDELIEALKKARALEFVENLPKKIETLVGERGVKLSGGEAQRIAIARAFLEDSPIVVLDEATSALDSITEQEIQAGIDTLMKDKTALVIAHRLSTILKMDRIVVMQEGQILEQGSHDELLKKNGKYAQMWQHQSGGFIGEE